ncbi:MAG: hypothetical protein V3S30_03130 [Thermoanaerobaculia bacterium]
MLELKPLSKEAVPAAFEKAVRYRLLNEPTEAESICRDILRVDPDNQDALIHLLLSLTDQFERRLAAAFSQARELLPRLQDEYSKSYYAGIIQERRAKCHLKQGGPGSGSVAYDWFRQAMESFDLAISLRPEGKDDAILRWNTCVRILEWHPEVKPMPQDNFEPLLE